MASQRAILALKPVTFATSRTFDPTGHPAVCLIAEDVERCT